MPGDIDSLTLADAAYDRNGFYPVLRLTVNGRSVVLSSEAKPTLLDAGIVVFNGDVPGLPPIEFQPKDGGRLVLESATRDTRVLRLFLAFVKAANSGSFTVGPVAIPD